MSYKSQIMHLRTLSFSPQRDTPSQLSLGFFDAQSKVVLDLSTLSPEDSDEVQVTAIYIADLFISNSTDIDSTMVHTTVMNGAFAGSELKTQNILSNGTVYISVRDRNGD
jgi:hypothetical protein